MPILTLITSYPQKGGPSVTTGAIFVDEEIMHQILEQEFSRVEEPNFRLFIVNMHYDMKPLEERKDN